MKQFEKCTIEELINFCNKQQCFHCPLYKHHICSDNFQIWELKPDEEIKLEIEEPKNLKNELEEATKNKLNELSKWL